MSPRASCASWRHGIGPASLGHLKDLPIDRLKIDKPFIGGLPADRGAA